MTLSFLRADLLELAAYSPHPPSGGQVPNQPEGIVDPLDTNESPYDLPAQLKQKLAWMVEQQIAANRYPDGAYRELKAAIADYVNQSAQLLGTFTAHHITVGNGSDELIRSLLMATCLGGEGAILVANPTFSMYAILARTLGIPVVAVDRRESDFAMDLEAAQAAITYAAAPPIRVVFVVHPNSPTGNGLTTAELDWLEQLPEQVLVVVDEAYFEFSQHTTVARVASRPNWVVLRTFSKAFRLAAYRVGYGVGHPGLIAALEKVRLPYNLPSIAQSAASLALAHRQELLAVVPTIQQQRQLLWTTLAEQTPLHPWPSVANFIYARPQPGHSSLADWFDYLKAQGTLIRHTGGGLRITVGSPAENQRTLSRIQARGL